jgi:hypothetical protein
MKGSSLVVSGRLSAALRPAGLIAVVVCMLLAEAIAAQPIAALLEETLSNPAPSYSSGEGMPYIPSTQSSVRDQDQSPYLLQTFLHEAKSKKRKKLDKLESSKEQDGLQKLPKVQESDALDVRVKELADYVKGEVTSIRNDVIEINATDTNKIQASFHLVEGAITMAGDAYGALAVQGQARRCCHARTRACVHTREHSCGQLARLLRVWPCLAQPVCGGGATEAVRLGAAQGEASWGGRRSEAASGERQQTCNDGRMRATFSSCSFLFSQSRPAGQAHHPGVQSR